MSKLVDKLERVSEGRDQPLGFGAAINRAKTLPVVIIGSISRGNADLATLATKTNVDAVLITIDSPQKIGDAVAHIKSTNVDIPWGLAVNTVTAEDMVKLVEAGCDFVVFSPDKTPATVLNEEKVGKVLQVEPSIDDNLLKSINRLSVDAVLLGPLKESEYPLTVNRLMLYERLASWSGKHILATVPPALSVEEIECFWGIGARGLVVDLGLREPEQRLSRIKEAVEKLQVKKRKPERKISASLPLPRESSIPDSPEEEEEDRV